MALATGSNWIWNFIVAFITPPLFNAISGGYYFIIVGFVTISFFLVWFVYRETAHCTLEQLSAVFGEEDPTGRTQAHGLGSPAVLDDVRDVQDVLASVFAESVAGRSELTLAPSTAPSDEKNSKGGEKGQGSAAV
jgi:hypothetical protein